VASSADAITPVPSDHKNEREDIERWYWPRAPARMFTRNLHVTYSARTVRERCLSAAAFQESTERPRQTRRATLSSLVAAFRTAHRNGSHAQRCRALCCVSTSTTTTTGT